MVERSSINNAADELSSTSSKRPEAPQRQLDDLGRSRVLECLKKLYNTPIYSTSFEIELAKMGLLSEFEQAGIVPIVENPNPFDAEYDELQHEQWWQDHSHEAKEFSQQIEIREKTLKILFLGTVVGCLYRHLLYRQQSAT